MMIVDPFMQAGVVQNLDAHQTDLWAVHGRKLRLSAYTGPSMRVRRSSDDAEQDIPFVASLLDAASLASFVGGASAYVTTVYDQTGNSRHWLQATAAKQPRIVNAGAYDGKLIFDGSDDSMSTAANCAVATGYTDFLVATVRGPAAVNAILERGSSVGGGGSNDHSLFRQNATPGTNLRSYLAVGTGFAEIRHADALNPDGTPVATVYDYASAYTTPATFYSQTSTSSTVASNTIGTLLASGTAAPYYLGARGNALYFAPMDFEETVLYSAALNGSTVAAVRAIMAT